MCELIGLRDDVAAETLAARDTYEAALDAYLDGDFAHAEHLFAEAVRTRPDDLAAQTMQMRSRELAAAPPRDWDGIHVMHEQ